MRETVTVNNLEVLCRIGIWDWEDQLAQKLQLDMELECEFSKILRSRKLEDTIDYVDLSKRVETLLTGKNFGYLEVVVDRVTDLVFQSFPAIAFKITIRKFTRDIPLASSVGVSRSIRREEWESARKLEPSAPTPEPPRDRNLLGKTSLVTGASQRLGRAMAVHLASRGSNVAVHYRRSKDEAIALVEHLKATYPDQHFATFLASLTDVAELKNLANEVRNSLGPIDILVNNVGHYVPKSLLEVSFDEFAETMRVNVEGTFSLTKIVVEQIIARGTKFGRVVNVGHVGALNVLARPKNSAYHLSKTALAVMTRSFADLCGPHAITVNMLNPGVLENSIDFPPDVLEQIPLRRLGTLRDVVSGLSFFVSDESAYVTGAALDISGGYGLRGSP